jgi:hypothetical protein
MLFYPHNFPGAAKMGNILLWLQERVKLWTKPATSVLIIGILSDLTRSHTDLVVENALLRQQLIVLNRQVKRPQLTNLNDFAWFFYPTLRRSGNKPYISFNRILCCAGIASCFNSIGGRNRRASQRFLPKRSCLIQEDGERESVMGSRADTW